MSSVVPRSQWQILTQMLRLTREYWFSYLGLFLLSFLSTPLALIAPLPLALVADHVVGQRPISASWLQKLPDYLVGSDEKILVFALMLLIASTILQQVDSYGNWLLQTYVGEKLTIDLKKRFFSHSLHLPFLQYRNLHSAEYIYRLQSDIPALSYIPIQWIIMASSLFSVGFMLYVMARMNLHLALLALGVLPFIYILLKVYEPKARRGWNQLKEGETDFLGFLKEALSAVLLIKGYGMEHKKAADLQKSGTRVLGLHMQAIVIESLFGGLIALLLAFGSVAILYMGTKAVLAGTLSLGHLILIMGYLLQLYKPLETLAKKSAGMQAATASAERVLAVLDLEQDALYLKERPIDPLKKTAGAILVRDLGFQYGERPPLFHELNLSVAARSFIGITGASGVGKSTLLQLLLGFLQPSAGEILVDGVPLREWGAESLRQMISVVFQDTIIFSGSIRDNIKFGMDHVSEEELRDAAARAHIHQFIIALPKAYDTNLGEGGFQLSGGERQRLALARAFLRDSPILILDEPTSSVDQASEREIVAALGQLVQNRTTILVSHRPESLIHCQQIFHLEGGKLLLRESHPAELSVKPRSPFS